jgi:arylsulfatase A-like enzyme
MTDDQGYADMRCTGNPWLETPNLDEMHDESVRFVDFHCSPLCTPTRGALMTGHRPVRNGAWATTWGRSMLRRDEVTMADVFAESGYRTGMFGKWHIGDNYPYRPQDRGFEKVVAHRGGGVGQTPDFWGNSYFDDTYFHNGVPVAHEGYCTDIWFDEAMSFIEESCGRPFFCYLATNAPHAPYLVADEYKEPYLADPEVPEPAFYGMIANIDENMGRLRQKLVELGIADNTILIFTTDNGSSGGWYPDRAAGRGYNAGMRGKKGSYYEGGHRVPFFLRWPSGGFVGGRNVDEMILHTDLLPTFIDLCGLAPPTGVSFDGISVAPLLRGEWRALPDRIHYLQYRQNTQPPEKWVNAVMTRRWRLIAGHELYDIQADPGQQHDVAERYPEVVKHLRGAFEEWWAEIAPGLDEYCPIGLGSDEENPIRLDAFDLMGDVAWNQTHIREAMRASGAWAVDVERRGEYEINLRRWPEEAEEPITDALADGSGVAIDVSRARLQIADFDQTVAIPTGARSVTFRVALQPGATQLRASFVDDKGAEQAAYYVYVKRLE